MSQRFQTGQIWVINDSCLRPAPTAGEEWDKIIIESTFFDDPATWLLINVISSSGTRGSLFPHELVSYYILLS